jgi:hypothetical protein
MIKRSIITALLVGHANPCSTIADYFHPADDEAGQFLKDYMLIGERQLTLESVCQKVDARTYYGPSARHLSSVRPAGLATSARGIRWSNIAQYLLDH